MSTDIGTVSARKEMPDSSIMKSSYKPELVYVNRFFGGVENGMMTQITFQSDGYAQLTREQTLELIKLLKKSITPVS